MLWVVLPANDQIGQSGTNDGGTLDCSFMFPGHFQIVAAIEIFHQNKIISGNNATVFVQIDLNYDFGSSDLPNGF